jgi:TonB family protein
MRLRVGGPDPLDFALLNSDQPAAVSAHDLAAELQGLSSKGQTRILVGWRPADHPSCTAVAQAVGIAEAAGVVVRQPIGDPVPYRQTVMEACAQVELEDAAKANALIKRPIEAPGIEGGIEGSVPGGVGGIVDERGLPPPPPPPTEPVRVGGTIKEPRKLKNVNPEYPAIARSARVQGVVILEATISPQGHVTNVRVLRGIPLLDQAAVDAVEQWQYTPTLLNGVPVPVIMTITVNFQLK